MEIGSVDEQTAGQPDFLPAVSAEELGKVVDALRKTAADPTAELSEEDRERVSRFPIIAGNRLELHKGPGVIEKSTILGVPQRLDKSGAGPTDWFVPVRLDSGTETNYHVFALGMFATREGKMGMKAEIKPGNPTPPAPPVATA